MTEPEKMNIFTEIINQLHPDGPYAPSVWITDVEKDENIRKAMTKLNEERLKHAMGLDREFPTAFEAAYEKAMKKKKGAR